MLTKKTELTTAPMGAAAKSAAEEAAAAMEKAMMEAAAAEQAETEASLAAYFSSLEARQAEIDSEAAAAAAALDACLVPAEGENKMDLRMAVDTASEVEIEKLAAEVLNDGTDIEISDEIAEVLARLDNPKEAKVLSAGKTARTLDTQIAEAAAEVMEEAASPMYRNPVRDKAGTWTVELNHPVLGWIPFTASPDDDRDYGRDLFALIEREHA